MLVDGEDSEGGTKSMETAAPAHLPNVVIRFAGDSGDGIQLAGGQFTNTVALQGSDWATLPDFPAEIRAPAGSLYGISGFQIQFGGTEVMTPGDSLDALVVMNPAALRVHLEDLKPGGLLLANSGTFHKANLQRAGYDHHPLEDGSLSGFRCISLNISQLAAKAVRPAGLTQREAERTKNIWTLGLMLWLFSHSIEPSLSWLERRYRDRPQLLLGNTLALRAGNAYGETHELFHQRFQVERRRLPPGRYRNLSGNLALAWGLLVAAERANRPLVFGSSPFKVTT